MSRLTTIARIGRRMKISVKAMSARSRLYDARDLDLGAGLHAKLAFGDDNVAGLQTLVDHHLVADAPAGLDRHDLGLAAAARILAPDDDDAVALCRGLDRRTRHNQPTALRGQHHTGGTFP